jgi:hypothetical protein
LPAFKQRFEVSHDSWATLKHIWMECAVSG